MLMLFIPTNRAVLDVNQLVGSTILQVQTNKNDSDIKYSMDPLNNGSIGDWLEIDQQTGRIVLVSPVPAHLSNVTFHVVATINANPPIESRVLASVIIEGLSGKALRHLLFMIHSLE